MRNQGRLAALSLMLACSAPALSQVNARFANFAPFAQPRSATAIDAVVDGSTLVAGITYPQAVGYQALGASGNYQIVLRPTGSGTGVSIDAELPDGDFTFVLIGDQTHQPVQGLGFQDLNAPPASGVKLRFVHAAAFAGGAATISIRDQGGDPAFAGLSDLDFGEITNYLVMPAGTYDFRITTADGSVTLADPVPITFDEGAVDTLVLIGNGTAEPIGLTSLVSGEIDGGPVVDHTATGVWYDPETAGQGAQFMTQPAQNRLLGFFYTYDLEGDELVWYHFDSCNSAPGADVCATPGEFDGISAEVTIYRASGGVFNDPTPASLSAVGSGTIELLDCDHAMVTADFGNGAGTVVLDYTRLGDRVACSAALAN